MAMRDDAALRTTAIPVVDLAGTREDASCRAAAAAAIGAAATDTGFFYVINHGVAAPLVAQAFAQAARFFDRPIESKLALLMTRGQARGYEPLEFQQLEAERPSDLKESLSVAGDIDARTALAAGGTVDVQPNRWPPDLPGFRENVLAYYTAAIDLGAHLMALIALALDLQSDAFVEPYRDANPTLRMLRYPPDRAGTCFGQIGAGAHTDWGGITILAQDAAGGLEIRDPAGQWLQAAPIDGAFVINLGDLMVRWTNDRYRSSMHRVLNTVRVHDRHSIALFYSPNIRARIAPLSTCVSPEQPARYEPCTAGEHIAQRRRETYGIA